MMLTLPIVMFIASLGFLYFMIRQINKNVMLFDQAFIWFIIGAILLIISIFNNLPTWFSKLLGFELTSNFLLSLFVFFLLVVTFLHSLALSKQKEEIKVLLQELAITEKRLKEMEKKHD